MTDAGWQSEALDLPMQNECRQCTADRGLICSRQSGLIGAHCPSHQMHRWQRPFQRSHVEGISLVETASATVWPDGVTVGL